MQRISPSKPIERDNKNRRSPDAFAERLLREVEGRIPYLEESRAYLENAPLRRQDEIMENEAADFSGISQLREMSRNPYARLIRSSTTDKLGIRGFRTAEARGESGDKLAEEIFNRDDMGVNAQEAMDLACGYRNAYLHVDPFTKRQSILPPTNAAVISDASGEPAVGLFVAYNRLLDKEVLTLYMREVNDDTGTVEGPVHRYVATRDQEEDYGSYPSSKPMFNDLRVTTRDTEVPLDSSFGQRWVWWKMDKVTTTERVPITPLRNKDGKSEFEDFTDIIDRINHMIFQRVVIATLQGFRQRAVKGKLPKTDENGKNIDYDELFQAGPGTLWTLPDGVELWESAPPDFTSILAAVKDDTRDLGSQSYTPMDHLSDSANQSAEGAISRKESHLAKIEDRRKRFGSRWKRHLSILLEVNGEEKRADESSMEVIWQPLQMESLNQRVQAFASLRASGVAYKTALREAMAFTPTEIRQAVQESNAEKLLALTKPADAATPLQKQSFGVAGDDNGGGNANGGGNGRED